MKKILNKKFLIIGIAFIIIIVPIIIKLLNKNQKTEIKMPNDVIHTMYVKINPLIKLTFKETFNKCIDEKTKEESTCSVISPIIDYDLINDDAKEIYNDLDFKDKTVYDVLTMLCDTARENEIAFNNLEITTDYNFNINDNEILSIINEKSNYEYNFSVYVDFKEHIIDKEVISDYETNVKKFIIAFDTNGGNEINSIKVKENELITIPTTPSKKDYKFVSWQLDGKDFDFNTKIVKDITLTAKWEKVNDIVINDNDTNNNEATKYTISFDTNGGNIINSITVEEKKTVNKPTAPIKNGYDFVEWQLDGKKFDFNTKITKDITLTAKWTKTITSTLDKINLNENILIYKTGLSLKGCGSDIVFADNTAELFADYKANDGYGIFGNGVFDGFSNPKFEVNYNDYATDEERFNAENIMNAARSKDFDEKKAKLIYNSSNANKAQSDIKNYLKTIKGLKSFSVNNNPQSFNAEILYIWISNSSSLGNFGKNFNQYYSNIESKINSVLKQYGAYRLSFGGCGSYDDTPPSLLTEEICSEYHLTCDRW